MDFNLNPYVSAILNADVLFVTLGTSSTKLTERILAINSYNGLKVYNHVCYKRLKHIPFSIYHTDIDVNIA